MGNKRQFQVGVYSRHLVHHFRLGCLLSFLPIIVQFFSVFISFVKFPEVEYFHLSLNSDILAGPAHIDEESWNGK